MSATAPRMKRHLRKWADLWGVPKLHREISFRFDNRLKRSLGRCSPTTKEISLHPDLRDDLSSLLEEVLCHEFAHVAVEELHGSDAQPHGEEWQELVRSAGYRPRTRVYSQVDSGQSARASDHVLYDHSCPVCHFSRVAKRPVPNWRCPECRAAGLEGQLKIVSHERSR